jgi:hypothetical protein
MNTLVKIDSNALTYLGEAIEPVYDPSRDDPGLAEQRVAMIRSYFYGSVQFWVLPTVELECDQIRNRSKHRSHQHAVRQSKSCPSPCAFVRAGAPTQGCGRFRSSNCCLRSSESVLQANDLRTKPVESMRIAEAEIMSRSLLFSRTDHMFFRPFFNKRS